MVLLFALFISRANADSLSQDEQLHALASYSINTTLLLAGSSRMNAAGGTLTLGLLKEALDPKFSTRDLAADVVGIVLSTVCSFVIEF